jgi:MerR family transcriptional regulator, light-induced transcriptional regulator
MKRTNEQKYYNTREAAQFLGVNISTIKRWTDAQKLPCIQTTGGHRKFLLSHFLEFLDANPQMKASLPLNIASPEKHPLESQPTPEILSEKALDGDETAVLLICTRFLLGKGELALLFDETIMPALRLIGEKWAKGEIEIAREHVATAAIRDALVRLKDQLQPLVPAAGGNVLAFALADDSHDINLKMAELLLSHNGYRVYNCGAQTPLDGIERLLDEWKIEKILLSSVYHQAIPESQKIFNNLMAMVEAKDIPLFLGGPGFKVLEIPQKEHIIYLESYKAMAEVMIK